MVMSNITRRLQMLETRIRPEQQTLEQLADWELGLAILSKIAPALLNPAGLAKAKDLLRFDFPLLSGEEKYYTMTQDELNGLIESNIQQILEYENWLDIDNPNQYLCTPGDSQAVMQSIREVVYR
jgi:hypothetical protein